MNFSFRWAAAALLVTLTGCTITTDDLLKPDAKAPTELTATAAVDTVAIDLAWTGDKNATSYKIYRAESKAALSPSAFANPEKSKAHRKMRYELLAETPGDEVEIGASGEVVFTDTGVTKGTIYYYRVRAVSQSGNLSAPSNLASTKPGPQGPAPTAPSILTALNEVGTSQVSANDPRPAMKHTYTITTTPVHGTATVDAKGLVSFTPATGYEGKDSLAVNVKAADGRAGDVTIGIAVGNRAPSPTAKAISMSMNGSGSTQVMPGDPDKADTHTFAIDTAPSAGTVNLSGTGLLEYTPPVNYSGTQTIIVEVTDNNGASGKATVLVIVGAPEPSSDPVVPGVFCNDGSNHVALKSITLAPGTILEPSTDYDFTAVISYAVTGFQDVGIYLGVGTYYTQNVSGCGEVTVSGTFNTGGNSEITVYAIAGTWEFQGRYLVTSTPEDMPMLELVSTTFPEYTGYLLDNIQYEFFATYGYNPMRSSGIWSTFFEVDELNGQGDWYPYFSPINTGYQTRKMRLRSSPACGDDSIAFEAYLSNDISPNLSHFMSVPIAPPVMETYDFYVNYPLLTDDQTVGLEISDCTGTNPTVQLVPSSDFFSVDQETVTLPAWVNITYHAAKVPVGQSASGVLQIISETGEFTTKTLDVSARRFGLDLSQYTWANCTLDCSTDDGERTIPLPFNFPIGAGSTDVIYANTNGALHFGLSNGNYDDYGNMDGPFNDLDPGYFGDAFIPFFWTDNRVGWGWNYADERTDWDPGIYYRDMGTYVEILYWDHFSYSDYTNRQVFLHRVYADGHVELTFPMINPAGVETVAVYSPTGLQPQVWDVWSISNGETLNVPSVPAD